MSNKLRRRWSAAHGWRLQAAQIEIRQVAGLEASSLKDLPPWQAQRLGQLFSGALCCTACNESSQQHSCAPRSRSVAACTRCLQVHSVLCQAATLISGYAATEVHTGVPADTGPEVTLGREPPADAALVAAARLLAASEEGSLQGRSLAQLGNLGMPLTKDTEVCSPAEVSSAAFVCISCCFQAPACSLLLASTAGRRWLGVDPAAALGLISCAHAR